MAGANQNPQTLDDKMRILQTLYENTYFDAVSKCHLWNGATLASGYGYIQVYNKEEGRRFQQKTHRLAAWIWLGLDIENPAAFALHKVHCTSRRCWNPQHLYIGNDADNLRDRYEKSRKAQQE